MNAIGDAIKSAVGTLAPTSTVVRQRDGTVEIERAHLLSDEEKASRRAQARSAAAAAPISGTRSPSCRTQGTGAGVGAAGGGASASALGEQEAIGHLFTFDVSEAAWTTAGDRAEPTVPSVSPQLDQHSRTRRKLHPPTPTPAPTADLPETLRVASFNVWFGALAWEHRTDALVNLVLRQDSPYDVVCLQEVTPKVLHRLAAHRDVRAHFSMTDSGHGETIAAGYGVVMMVRVTLPAPTISRVVIPSTMGRDALVATFAASPADASASASTAAVATVHLESLNSTPTRTAQLKVIHAHLARHATAVLTGDFNISATGPYGRPAEHAALATVFPAYSDIWVEEHGGDGDDASAAGFGAAVTFETTINTMNKLLGSSAECSRYDRVLVKNGGGKGSNVNIIGNTPILPRPAGLIADIFISDHFGLGFDLSTRVARGPPTCDVVLNAAAAAAAATPAPAPAPPPAPAPAPAPAPVPASTRALVPPAPQDC